MVLDHKTNPLLPNFNFAPAAIFQLEKKLKQNQPSVNSCPVWHLWFIYRPKYNSQSQVSLSFGAKLSFLPLFFFFLPLRIQTSIRMTIDKYFVFQSNSYFELILKLAKTYLLSACLQLLTPEVEIISHPDISLP